MKKILLNIVYIFILRIIMLKIKTMFSVDSILDTIHQTDDNLKNDLISSIEVVVRKSFREKLGKDLLGDESIVTVGITNLVKQRAQECFGESTLKKPRKNKYGLEMTNLEQELDDIKLGFREIEKFDSRGNKKEDSYSFFMRVYGKYRQANVIYQADLLSIDKQLLKSLTNFFHRGRYSEEQIKYHAGFFT